MAAPRTLLLLSAALLLPAQSRDDRWRQDLNALARQLPAAHPNLFFQTSRADFDRAVASLDAAIPRLTDSGVVVALAAVTALAGDSHTTIPLPQAALGWRRLPLTLRWLNGELRVTAASEPFRRALGARVTRIGEFEAGAALAEIGTVLPHENPYWLRFFGAGYLVVPEILQALGIAPAGGLIRFSFLADTGEAFSLDLPGFTAAETPPRFAVPDPNDGPLPLYRQNSSLSYWFRYLAAERVLYLKYTVCRNDPARPFAQVAQEMLAILDTQPVDKLVFDFRGNTGGDSSVINPLYDGLRAREARFGAGLRAYAVIDGGVFSSGLLNAAVFAGQPVASIVGENSGGKPVHYGNVRTFNLPNSGLTVQHSTMRFDSPLMTDSLVPDLPVPLTAADYFARHDPVLAAILAGDPTPSVPLAGNLAVLNGATFRLGDPLTWGMLATAFGDFSGAGAADAATLPLPRTLGNVRVLVDDTPAPLVAVRPAQINFQMPGAPPGVARARGGVRVEVGGVVRAETTIQLAAASPGLFVISVADTDRPGAILNQDSRVNSREYPARAGEVIQIFATGAGRTDPEAPEGAPAPRDPLARTVETPRVYIAGERAEVLFSGLSAEFPGLWQLNVRVPASAQGRVPVFAVIGNRASNGATFWVAR